MATYISLSTIDYTATSFTSPSFVFLQPKKLQMKKKFTAIFALIVLTSCAELQQVISDLPQSGDLLSNADIASGLRQALDQGIDKQVTKLTQTDGFF